MLTRSTLRTQDGSALITALMVMLVMLPIGMALLAIVDTQARNSGTERTSDRAFNLADSAMTSAAFNLGRISWPTSVESAPSNAGPVGAAGTCGANSYGATLGAATNPGSATASLQPNLNASYDDSAYTGATWQINVCDDDVAHPGSTVWNDGLLAGSTFDANNNQRMWVRSEARVGDKRRVIASLVKVQQAPALSSKFGLIAGRMNSDVSNTAGTVLTGGAVGDLTSSLLGTEPLVAADPSVPATSPASTGVIAVRCGALDGCLTGALAGLGSLSIFNTLVTGGKLVQSTSPTATSAASIEQLRQQAKITNTYRAVTAGSTSSSNPPACDIPAAASSSTIVFIDQVGSGTIGAAGGPGDQFCKLDVSSNRSYKALIIGSGRVVIRGDNTTDGGTFSGLLYALNEQRKTSTIGDASIPSREVIRIDQGAHVRGGVAADGKSAQVGIYPPTMSCNLLNLYCALSGLLDSTLGFLNSYNPAIRADVQLMDAVKIYDSTSIIPGTYRDIIGATR